MQMSRDGSSLRSSSVPAGGVRADERQACTFEWLDTGVLVVRQARELVVLAPNQVDALLSFLETVSRLATAEMQTAIERVEVDES